MIDVLKKFFIKLFTFLIIATPSYSAFDIKATSVILQDYFSGEILFENFLRNCFSKIFSKKILANIFAKNVLQ